METIKVVSQPIQSMYGKEQDKPMLKFKDDKGIEYAQGELFRRRFRTGCHSTYYRNHRSWEAPHPCRRNAFLFRCTSEWTSYGDGYQS